MRESITPKSTPTPDIRYQPSMMSVPSAASTVRPEDRGPNSAQQPPKRPARRKLWFFAALSVLAGVAAASALQGRPHVSSHVQSGSPGYRKSPSGKDLHWEKKALTVYLDNSLQRLGPNANEAVMQAFGQWVGSDKRLPDLSFDTGPASSIPAQDGKSTVSYGRIDKPGHEHDVGITVTYANDKTGEIIEADVVLNALYPMAVLTAKTPALATKDDGKDKDADKTGKDRHSDEESVDCGNRYDTQNVATHEVGHFFGLGEDMTERKATMFLSIGQCETHKRVLAATDVGALGTLYAEQEDPEEAKAGPRACSFGGAPAAGGAAWVSGAILGLMLLRRRRSR